MDELKIKSKLMRGIVSKLLASLVYQKTGYKVDIQLNDISATINEGTAQVHIDADAVIGSEEFTKVIKSIGI